MANSTPRSPSNQANRHSGFSRRRFLTGVTSAGLASALPSLALANDASAPDKLSKSSTPPDNSIQLCIFSKHLEWLDYPAAANKAAELGFDGLDLTVRPGGHVEPARVEEDLPRAVEAARDAGLDVPMMTTRINDPDDEHTEPILKTARDLGIKYYRFGTWHYNEETPVMTTLDRARPQLRKLAQMNKEYGLIGSLQNHSGWHYVGASVWDTYNLIEGLDWDWIGCQFDIRHATVEGGQTWPILFRLISDAAHTLVAKDFLWEQTDKGWEEENVPLGEGMVDFPRYFELVKKSGFSGPISVHYEYSLGGAGDGDEEITISEEEFDSAVSRDLGRLQGWLQNANLL